jgi:small subunit ribosomal protein S14
MTTSDHKKMIPQLEHDPGKMAKYRKHNTPKKRAYGENTKKCGRCGRTGGHISKYGLGVCRQCFREIATNIGFKKYS